MHIFTLVMLASSCRSGNPVENIYEGRLLEIAPKYCISEYGG
jgi:hypothetical protein